MKKMKLLNNDKQINLKIPDSIIKIISVINQTLYKYIKDNLNEEKIIEAKLLFINNYIKEKFLKKHKSQNEIKLLKPEKLHFKSYISNTLVTPEKLSIYKNKSVNYLEESNSYKNRSNPKVNNEMNLNNYINFKLKKKLKQEHDKNKIKELEYLERIAVLQCKVNLYEKNFEKLILENNSFKIQNGRNNSTKNDNNNKKIYYKIKNTKVANEKNRPFTRPLSSTIDAKISNLKKYFKNFSEIRNSRKNNSMFETYINANANTLDSYLNMNKKRNRFSSHNDFNYKYEIGNSYLRNDFREIKRTIHKNNDKIVKIINNCLKSEI